MDRPVKAKEKHTNTIFSFAFTGGFTGNFSKKPILERGGQHPYGVRIIFDAGFGFYTEYDGERARGKAVSGQYS